MQAPHPLLVRPHHISELPPAVPLVQSHCVSVPSLPRDIMQAGSEGDGSQPPQDTTHPAGPPPAAATAGRLRTAAPTAGCGGPQGPSSAPAATVTLPSVLSALQTHGGVRREGGALQDSPWPRLSDMEPAAAAAVHGSGGALAAVDVSAALRRADPAARSAWAAAARLPPPHECVVSDVRQHAARDALRLSVAGPAPGGGGPVRAAAGVPRWRGRACGSHCAVRFAVFQAMARAVVGGRSAASVSGATSGAWTQWACGSLLTAGMLQSHASASAFPILTVCLHAHAAAFQRMLLR